jgi:hypothetical protein
VYVSEREKKEERRGVEKREREREMGRRER